MTASVIWLGGAGLFFSVHRLGPVFTVGYLVAFVALAITFKYRIVTVAWLEDWYEDFLYARRMARVRRRARQEEIDSDPTNQQILYIQQFASPHVMLTLTPDEFFDVVVCHFRLLGYARRHQRIFESQAGDAILRYGELLYLLRCLRVDKGVLLGEDEIGVLAGMLAKNQCVGGFMVTNSIFTADAYTLATKRKIVLVDGPTLAASIQAFRFRDPTVEKPGMPPKTL